MKHTLIYACALLATATMTLNSCANKKTETNNNDEQQTEIVTNDPVISDTQRQALINSNLVNEADFNHTIYIDFNATWCGPCRQFAPYFKAASEKYADKASFIAVDVDQYGEVANAFGVESIPTMIAIKSDGKYYVYVGTNELVGDGAFDSIVEKYL